MTQSRGRNAKQGNTFLHPCPKRVSKSTKGLSKSKKERRHKKVVALDCEMVGVGPMKVSVLARVSIVNYRGLCVFDTFVKVEEPVTDYRTEFSGIRREDLESKEALPFGEVRTRVRKILSRAILVGHGLENDLAVLNLSKAPSLIRDTSLYFPFMAQSSDGTLRARRLRDLVWEKFGVVIQSGEHNSMEDAWAAMSLYKLVENEWHVHSLAPHHGPLEPWSPNLATESMKRQLCAEANAWVPQDVN